MNKPTRKTIFVVAAIILASLLIAAAIAVTIWTHDYNWNAIETITFTVYKNPELTTVYATGGTTTIPNISNPYTEIFYVKNTGNVAIIVNATATITGATFTWMGNPTPNIAVSSNASITLTISGFQIGAGSLTVIFTSAKA